MSSASVSSPPASTGSRRRCLSISPASGGRCRSPCSACRRSWRCFPPRCSALTAYGARRLRLAPAARICLFAVLWSAAEWLRGHVLTGFPWNLVGYVWSGGFPGALAMLQSTAWVGIYGLSFLTVLAASLPALLGGTSLLPMPRGAARRAGGRRRAADPGARVGRRDPARAAADAADRYLAAPGAALGRRRASNGTRPPPRPISAA